MNIKDFVRPEVLNLKPYIPAKKVLNKVRLNANESPYSVNKNAIKSSLNLYPDARPDQIKTMIADYLKLSEDSIVISRGSTEAIDVIIRTFCIPNQDGILIFPPTFEMYQFYAAIQGVDIHTILLNKDNNYSIDIKALEAFKPDRAKLVLQARLHFAFFCLVFSVFGPQVHSKLARVGSMLAHVGLLERI